MLNNPNQVILDFISSVTTHYPHIAITATDIKHEFLLAPHCNPKLPKDTNAVYVFTFTDGYHISDLVGYSLKVGKAGKGSRSRFDSNHYSITQDNSAARSLHNNPILWNMLGITYISSNGSTVMSQNAGNWLKANTDRDHFFIDSNLPFSHKVMCLLEVYLRGNYGSFLEGTAQNR